MSSRWKRWLILLLIYGLLLGGGHLGGAWLQEHFEFEGTNGHQAVIHYAVWAGVILYVVLLAIPFVPGIEISLGLLAAFGRDIVPLIYVATIASLTISFLIGRFLPLKATASVFRFVSLERTEELVKQLAPLNSNQRLALLLSGAPKRFVSTLIKYRYVAIVVLLNVPGNAIVGGGGGIALLAGTSGLFSFTPFITAVALAAMPVPLLAYMFGS
ncbi:MAG: hypothetical protein JXQ99_19890 [Hyphomicrobiaceae bacterium]